MSSLSTDRGRPLPPPACKYGKERFKHGKGGMPVRWIMCRLNREECKTDVDNNLNCKEMKKMSVEQIKIYTCNLCGNRDIDTSSKMIGVSIDATSKKSRITFVSVEQTSLHICMDCVDSLRERFNNGRGIVDEDAPITNTLPGYPFPEKYKNQVPSNVRCPKCNRNDIVYVNENLKYNCKACGYVW